MTNDKDNDHNAELAAAENDTGLSQINSASDRMIPCVVCGALTEWRCADCAIGQFQASHPKVIDVRSIAVCASPACRDAHERSEAANHQFATSNQDTTATAGGSVPSEAQKSNPSNGSDLP